MLRVMDRDALRRFLEDPGRTLRWNRGERLGYEAVEIRAGRLIWFRWAHELGERVEVVEQSAAEYARDGAPRSAPPRVLAAVADALAATETPE